MNNRDHVQAAVTNTIRTKEFYGICDVSPRVGKSKSVIDALNQIPTKRILITYPVNTIADSWNTEISKWGPISHHVIYMSNQRSLKDYANTQLDLIILDEVHELSEAQINLLKVHKDRGVKLLGLTGSLSKETEIKLIVHLNLEVIFRYSVEDAVRDKIVSDYSINLVQCLLDNTTNNVLGGTKKNPFYTTEAAQYKYLTDRFNQFKYLAMRDASKGTVKMMFARKRAEMIYNGPTKIAVTKRIIMNHDRCLAFTARKAIANDLCEHSFHTDSPMYEHEGEVISNLEAFKLGLINKLSVVEMASMGMTFPDLKVGIFHQLKSNEETAIQKVMRMCNMEGDREAQIWIVYYLQTQDEVWVNKAISSFDSSKIHRHTVQMRRPAT